MNKQSMKVTNEFKDFLAKACSNYHINHGGDRPYNWEIAELIVKYFKQNNNRYIELMNTEMKKNDN